MHGTKEEGREGYRESVREKEVKRERDGEWEKDPHNLEREESKNNPIGEGLG